MKTLRHVPVILLISLFSAAALFPFLWLISTSFKGAEELFSFPPAIIPEKIRPENYREAWDAVPFGRYIINSLVVSSLGVFSNLLLSSLAGFALGRFKFRGRNAVFYLILATMMVPKEVLMIPLYITTLSMGLADSFAGVILPFAVDAFGIFMMRQAFSAIPAEIEEAGIIDGASPLRLWWNIMLPMTKPSLAALGIFSLVGLWGDFLWPLVVLKSPENYTLQVGLSYMTGTFVDNYRLVAAGAVLALVPVAVVFLFMQKYFERGIFSGSIK